MFGLVIFTDEVLYICHTDDISVQNNKCSVKYGKKKYAARVLALDVSDVQLKKIDARLQDEGSTPAINFSVREKHEKHLEFRDILNKCKDEQEVCKLFADEALLPLLSTSNANKNIFSLVNEEKKFFENTSRFVAIHENCMDQQVQVSPDVIDSINNEAIIVENTPKNQQVNGKENLQSNLNVTYPLDISRIDSINNEAIIVENAPKNEEVNEKENLQSNLNVTYPLDISGIDFKNDKAMVLEDTPKNEEMNEKENLQPNFNFPFPLNISGIEYINGTVDEDTVRSNYINVISHEKPRIVIDELLSFPFFASIQPSQISNFENENPRNNLEYVVLGNATYNAQPPAKEDQGFYNTDSIEMSHTEPIMSSTMCESATFEENSRNDKEYAPIDENLSDSEYCCSFDESSSEKIPPRQKSLNITLGLNRPGISAPDDANLRVAPSTSAAYLKKNFCLYCTKFQAKIARHLENVHGKEEDVKKFTQLPPKSKERKEIIAMIRKKGNHLYNNDKRFNTGELLVCRRPNERMQKTANDFIACGNCKGQYARSVIRHHFRKCTKKGNGNERVVIVSGRKVTARLHEKASSLVRKWIFGYLREDSIVRGIRYDELIILYANKQCEKYGTHQHLFQMVRARVRLLGRFVDAIKNMKPTVKTFAEVFTPRHYDAAVSAVRIVAGFDEETHRFVHPAVASNLGTLLKYCGDILRSEYIKRENELEQKRVEDFLKLLAEGYGTSVNRAVAETQAQNNRRKKIILPSTEDVKKLDEFLKAERTKFINLIKEKFSVDAWTKLAETTLLSLQIFNRRRPGELERIYVEDFKNYEGIDNIANKEAYAALSEEGKKLARKYVRFEIRGKLGRGVPVLVHSDVFECLKLLIHHRENAGVPEKNPYLFGLPSCDNERHRYLPACALMRKYSEQCNAEIPSALRGTKLRKHIATHCINLNLSEGQVTDLANFMGHEEKIHKEIYRQPVLETDIVGMSKILKIAQGYNESSEEGEGSEESEFDRNDKETSTKVTGNFHHEKIFLTSGTHKRWTAEQKEKVLSRFESSLTSGKMPSGTDIQDLINTELCLRNKNVAQVRSWLHTQKKNNMSDKNIGSVN